MAEVLSAQLDASVGQTGRGCPGTHQTRYDCNAISAIANVRQADAAEWFNHAAVVEIGVGLFTAIVAVLAARWAKRAAQAAHDANRPWIEAEAPSHVVMDLTAEGIKFSAEVGLLNHGHSPAINTLAQARLVALGNKKVQGERASTISRSGIEAALEEWEQIHGSRGKVVYPNRPDKCIILAELPIEEIRDAEGEPPEDVLYLLAVGVSYRFGTMKGQTVIAYLLELKNTATLSRLPYHVPKDTTELIKSYQVILTDTHEGYAV